MLLYGSTALFMASLAGHITSVNRLVTQAQAGLFSDAYTDEAIVTFEGDVLKYSWMMTIALGINVRRGLFFHASPYPRAATDERTTSCRS